MAFSFRIGTKWCHDFPKLAKESGFYFNMHRSRIRVDWNRISNIDIDRIIKERDFHSIDENINNVIDYCLESEYDVKILDPNFVKLFCLAQLAVEYLLYCKQYLDHSVMILKDELKLKIEENAKLKKEIATLEEIMKHVKEKVKEKSKLIETKIGDTNGEIYKCPHCPKSFISSMFVSAHIIRRHTHTSDLYMSVSPIHEHYRNETEKLHNEIKNLKERLNETEKVIRNESENICDKKILNYNKKQTENEIENVKYDNNKSKEHLEYKEYQEEIKNLKIMLFDEIHNLRQKENIMYERTSETNVQALISQQEKEFQKLKNQLFDKFTPDIESMHTKLYDQENYWKSKIEQLENQHHKDIERLTIELKLTQTAADDMKAKYEAKVNDLERQTANQSNILIEQSKQLHSLSHEINISQLNERNKDLKNNSLQKCSPSIILDNEISKKSDENNLKQSVDTIEQIITENNTIGTTVTSNLSNKVFPLTIEDTFLRDTQILNSKNKFIIHENKRNIKQKYEKTPDIENFDHIKTIKKDLEYYSSSNISDLENSMLEEENNSKHGKYNESIIKMDLHKPDINKLENVINKNTSNDFLSDIKNIKLKSIEENLSSVTNSESFISNSSIENDITIHNDSSLYEYKTQLPFSLKSKKITEHNYKSLQASLMNVFEQKLKDLGIDPEWQGIPKTTFKQKMDILKHHHKLAVKKLPKYHQIKLRIIEEVLNKISKKEKITENMKQFKKLSLHRPIIKELSDQQNPDSHISKLQAITLNEYYSTPEIKDSVKNIIENVSLPIKTQIANYKTVEELIDISPNSIKSLESVQDATNLQEFLIKKDFLNEIKPVFNSETFKVISNTNTISSHKFIENNDINNSNIQQELQNIFISPKHNKSVLKSTSGSTNSLIKKKVIFDLTNKKDKESYSDDDKEKKELYENTLSNSDEQKYLSQLEDYKNSSNIILKTAQSDKIAELSKKLEIQLNMVRQKPIGSVETIFSSKYIQNKKNQNKSIEQITPTSISSFVINPVQTSLSYSKKPNDLLPQPASYNLTDKISEILHAESVSEISDLDSDIDKILKLE
ncbi:zinc finger protein DZIP1L isoform X2 [Apis mellifera]|uniref:Zinc finger protein DZIP1L isoform X2 n=1 Tax=Apis mellifera TaxID=7460 RepID=A0A7M7MUY6_APIME|nr:zinc finger protein DZIP1L isoform X2 [Apis mellifera]|eukprot:XP_026301210.1 zinc finger protein DZIP1L isoform X2 [Apis mellifera]